MASLDRVRVVWTGTSIVGPGVSTFYTTGTGAALNAALKTYFTAITSAFPNLKGQWEFAAGGETIDSATGTLTGSWGGSTSSSIVMASPNASWVSGVGARVVWNTNGFVSGRRVRGSTFMVPLQQSAYDADGTLVGSFVTLLQTSANALVASVPQLTIWSRPTAAHPVGGATPVTSATVPDKVSWLRSRRT